MSFLAIFKFDLETTLNDLQNDFLYLTLKVTLGDFGYDLGPGWWPTLTVKLPYPPPPPSQVSPSL